MARFLNLQCFQDIPSQISVNLLEALILHAAFLSGNEKRNLNVRSFLLPGINVSNHLDVFKELGNREMPLYLVEFKETLKVSENYCLWPHA